MASGDDLKASFQAFCEFGGKGKTTMTTKNCTKLFKECKIYNKTLTTTDTDIAFSKVKTKGKTEITFDEFCSLLKEVAPKFKKGASADDSLAEMKTKIAQGKPGTAGTTGVSKTGGVAKMTDTSQYTGSHANRFDESGKGKGIDGREERAANDGYVGNYKGKDTFDSK